MKLWDDAIPNEEKLAQVKALYVPLVESLDDELVLKLPAGWQGIAKFVVDNPVVDGLEIKLCEILAEQTYQVVKAAKKLLGL
jgi:hypothetical protein